MLVAAEGSEVGKYDGVLVSVDGVVVGLKLGNLEGWVLGLEVETSDGGALGLAVIVDSPSSL